MLYLIGGLFVLVICLFYIFKALYAIVGVMNIDRVEFNNFYKEFKKYRVTLEMDRMQQQKGNVQVMQNLSSRIDENKKNIELSHQDNKSKINKVIKSINHGTYLEEFD